MADGGRVGDGSRRQGARSQGSRNPLVTSTLHVNRGRVGDGSFRGVVAAAGAGAIVFLFFLPAVSFPFLNWDDVDILVRNPALHAPGFVSWAFTTRYLEHFQPGAWLAWGAVDR